MRPTPVAEASCLYCSDFLIPDVPACEECARIEPRITRKLRAGTLDSPVLSVPHRLLRMHPRWARVWQVLGRPALLQS
jgi:hypothetical protein